VLGSFTSCLCDLQKTAANSRAGPGKGTALTASRDVAWPRRNRHHTLPLDTENHRRHQVESPPGSQRFLQRWLCRSELRNLPLATTNEVGKHHLSLSPGSLRQELLEKADGNSGCRRTWGARQWTPTVSTPGSSAAAVWGGGRSGPPWAVRVPLSHQLPGLPSASPVGPADVLLLWGRGVHPVSLPRCSSPLGWKILVFNKVKAHCHRLDQTPDVPCCCWSQQHKKFPPLQVLITCCAGIYKQPNGFTSCRRLQGATAPARGATARSCQPSIQPNQFASAVISFASAVVVQRESRVVQADSSSPGEGGGQPRLFILCRASYLLRILSHSSPAPPRVTDNLWTGENGRWTATPE